jgi:signal transduction histidine kinase/CheY-like chemotaxis protein
VTDVVTPGDPKALRDAVRAEQVRLLYADGLMSLGTTWVIAFLLCGLLIWSGTLSALAATVFLAFMTLHTAARAGMQLAYRRDPPQPADWKRWADRFVAGTAAGGLTWGVGLFWLLAPGRLDLQALVMAFMVTGTYGIVSSAGCYLPAFMTFFVPIVPAIVWFGLQGDALHLLCAATLVVWLPTVALLGRRYNASLVEALELRFENAALADGLRAQKHVAEQNNLAKSRFLAAASHDLRQPVHALGMFVGALRSHDLAPKSAELAEHMDASIASLDGLFTALLDVSRLDAGVIESRPATVELTPIFARIRRDLSAEAEAKGVRLVFAPTTVSVCSDPVLLERVMRNLVGNAVRYTDAGTVLVGCRHLAKKGGGKRISLEVWDTGRGIAPEQQEVIFEEFYQVAGKTSESGVGLGLGLAIVRRLTGLLEHPMTLWSEPGVGSVFRVQVPRVATPRRLGVELAAATPPADPAAALIVAIDDEAVVRTAMAELLSSWGHRVIPAASGEAALAALKGGVTPDLIVCDFRLARGETGLQAIARLQAACGVRIPAILLTGETAPEKLREAQAGGYPLLHKPLAPGRLRAAVSTVLRRTGGAAAVAAE